ncbi:hypothetical protein [Streptomyces sp. NPDC058683]|uniref:hypothetical protein n=1 Tax=Streptomyces sp. NPDC058683 TaxID=3346597 RepID=UPI0036687CFC
MAEVELVVTALAAGAAAGLTDTPRGTVHDLCTELREAVRRRLASDGGDGVRAGYGVRVLDAYETDPDVWRTRLLQVLTSCGAETDQEILAAARAVLRAERRTGYITLGTRRSGSASAGNPVVAHMDRANDLDVGSSAEAERVLVTPVWETDGRLVALPAALVAGDTPSATVPRQPPGGPDRHLP